MGVIHFIGPNVLSYNPPAAAPGPSLWTPADITTETWLDASDESTVTLGGGRVTTWADKSGNGRDANGGSGAQYLTSDVNGLNVVQLAGNSADWMFMDLNWMAGAKYHITALVTRNDGGGNYLTGRQSGATNGLFHIGWDNSTTFRMSHFSAGDYNLSVPAFTTEQLTLFSGLNRSGVGKILRYFDPSGFYNTTNGATLDLATNSDATLGNFGNGIYYGGKVCEIVMTGNDISDDDLYKVEGYLAWKWGQEALLPVGHPYKDAAPTNSAPGTPEVVTDSLEQYINPLISSTADQSGNGRNATLVGGLALDGDSYYDLNGFGKWIDLSWQQTLNAGFTWSGWLNITSVAATAPVNIISNYRTSTTPFFQYLIEDASDISPGELMMNGRTTTNNFFGDVDLSTTDYRDSNWYNFVVSYDATTGQRKGYVNGTLVHDVTDGTEVGDYTSAQDLVAYGGHLDRYFDSALGGALMLYSKQLSDEEVLQNYNALKADYGL